jgi:histidinol-phosphate aminotransferase
MSTASGSASSRSSVRLRRRSWLEGIAALGVATLGSSRLAVAKPNPPPAIARLSLNESPFGPSSLALAAISRVGRQVARYTGQEAVELVRQIAAYEGVPSEHIVLGEVLEPLGLQLGLNGGPGGELVYSVPGYNALVEAAAPVGGVSVGVPLDDAGRNDLAGLSAKVTRKTRAVFLANPHNPTGTVHDASAFRDFVRELAKKTLVVVDEAHLEFTADFEVLSLRDLVLAGANVVVFRTPRASPSRE